MHIIARPPLHEFARNHPDAKKPLDVWWKTVRKKRWMKFADVRSTYSSADMVGNCVVFNIRGNKYRLIVKIDYATETFRGIVLIRAVLTHAEYDRGMWKEDCKCP